ncbi:hypothetical protein RRG08_049447 [Elysia crispata]|uniref:Uncharacterized protein n=1 Tax=Elysia crispata TaxID=231223 RepID=A0AAE1DKZ8_9GAST|nr:hypothetical protein RRG08_049447 [Elysia crispata]
MDLEPRRIGDKIIYYIENKLWSSEQTDTDRPQDGRELRNNGRRSAGAGGSQPSRRLFRDIQQTTSVPWHYYFGVYLPLSELAFFFTSSTPNPGLE